MTMTMNRLQIILEPKHSYDNLLTLRVKVDIYDKDELNYEVVIPEDDFMSLFDFAWRHAKH